MAGSKRDRQRASRQQRLAEAAAAQRKAEMRRNAWAGGVAVLAVALIAVAIVVVTRGNGSKKSTSTATATSAAGSTATSAAGAPATSAAGAPACVMPTGPFPAGAPVIPVKVGPPPAALVTQDIKVGTGATVTAGQTVTVNYIGAACSTGKIFDSSYGPGKKPATFPLSQVIPGWQQGIPGMKAGGRRLLGIPPAQAYGARGQPPTIGPNETLWFVVDVVSAA